MLKTLTASNPCTWMMNVKKQVDRKELNEDVERDEAAGSAPCRCIVDEAVRRCAS